VKKDVFLLIDDIVTWLQLKGGEEREKKVMKKKKKCRWEPVVYILLKPVSWLIKIIISAVQPA
jgi:hypothetical protein